MRSYRGKALYHPDREKEDLSYFSTRHVDSWGEDTSPIRRNKLERGERETRM